MTKKIKYPKLPIKFKEKWLNALRSGDYKKGTFKLEKDNKFCCLGVACKITHPELNLRDEGFIRDIYNLSKLTTKVPKILKGGDDNNLVVKLTKMNDSGHYSFKRIANWIEENL